MAQTGNSIIQQSFNLAPAFANKVSPAAVFDRDINLLFSCLGLCLLHMDCNVIFFDNTTRHCSGTNDTDVETFVNSLMDRRGTIAYRLASKCDRPGYVLNAQTGQCLRFVLENKTWSQAKQFCEEERSTLLKIDNMERFWGAINLSYIYFKTPQNFFVGASDIASEGAWTWLDGTAVEGIPINFNNIDMEFIPIAPANCGVLAPFYKVVGDSK